MTHRSHARGEGGTIAEEQLAITWHAAALLLSHPSEALMSQLYSVHRATHLLPDALGGPLRSTIVHLEQTPLAELQQEYLTTFSGPHAEPGLGQRLSAALERAASVDLATGVKSLVEEWPLLERLRSSLLSAESAWMGAVSAVAATLVAWPELHRPGRWVGTLHERVDP